MPRTLLIALVSVVYGSAIGFKQPVLDTVFATQPVALACTEKPSAPRIPAKNVDPSPCAEIRIASAVFTVAAEQPRPAQIGVNVLVPLFQFPYSTGSITGGFPNTTLAPANEDAIAAALS